MIGLFHFSFIFLSLFKNKQAVILSLFLGSEAYRNGVRKEKFGQQRSETSHLTAQEKLDKRKITALSFKRVDDI